VGVRRKFLWTGKKRGANANRGGQTRNAPQDFNIKRKRSTSAELEKSAVEAQCVEKKKPKLLLTEESAERGKGRGKKILAYCTSKGNKWDQRHLGAGRVFDRSAHSGGEERGGEKKESDGRKDCRGSSTAMVLVEGSSRARFVKRTNPSKTLSGKKRGKE